jgi:hypothetical protein
MKCLNCKGDVPPGYKGQTCPSCGEALPRKRPVWRDLGERISSFTEDRGYLFWLIVFSLLLFFVAVFENLLADGVLAHLLDGYKFISLLMFLYAAAHLQILRNINTVFRPGYPGPYWIDRLIIKNFKRGTNYALIAGFIISLIIVGPLNFLELLPAYIFLPTLFSTLFWSIQAFRVDDREFTDAKVQSYFEFLGIRRLREWRQVSGVYLIGIVVSGGVFYGLSHIPGLWWKIKADPTLNEIIALASGLFNWVPQILPNK